MFKLSGFILIIFSCFYIFNYRLICDYRTYKFLEETIRVLQLLKIECTSGKTYPQIFSDINSGIYKSFSFENKESFFHKINADNKTKTDVINFFNSVGRRDIDSESEFITNNIKNFQYKAKILKENYDKNKKSSFLAGVSTGLVIVIVLI